MDERTSQDQATASNAPPSTKDARLTILDLFVLTACCALGMAFVRIASALGGTETVPRIDAVTVITGVIMPCLVSGLIVGHPLLVVLHTMTGRRQEALTFGEAAGLVPMLSTAALVLIGFLVASVSPIVPVADGIFFLCIAAYALTNIGISMLAFIYGLMLISNRDLATWTNCLGTAAALIPGAYALLVFVAVLISR